MGGELTSAAVPSVGPTDHVRGEGPDAVVYLDLACPHCALVWSRIRDLPLRLAVRHFPVSSKHPRAPALHAAAEAAGLQGAFWPMAESLLLDRGHHDDPHLWQRARRLDLDLERFEQDRRSEAVLERVHADFRSGIRGGVSTTPAAFVGGRAVGADPAGELARLAGR